MKHSKTSKIVCRAVLGALGLTLIGMTSAWATPTVVTSWGYSVSTEFDNSDTSFSNGQGSTTNDTHKLAWGVPSSSDNPTRQQSSLVIGNPDGSATTGSGSMTTYTGGGGIPNAFINDSGVIMTHNNFTIASGSKELLSSGISNTITLTPAGGTAMTLPTLTFGISFDETPNTQGTCPVAPTAGNRVCPDIFVIDNHSLNQSFTYDGQTYFVSVFALDHNSGVPIGVLPTDACTAAGASAGCLGFVTQEGLSTPIDFGFAISSVPLNVTGVPEPGTLGMLGLGLLGLIGLEIRRRRLARA